MRQTITALLLTLTLVLGLSGCTSKKDNGNSNDIPGNNTTQNGNSTDNYGSNNNTTPNYGTDNNGTLNGNTNNGTMNGGTNSDTNNATNGNSDDLLGSRSYDQMLRDGRIHDTDGILTDGENSVSEW